MNKEGKFKKRILAMCPPFEECFFPEKNQEIFDNETVLKLIDDAKKEFPIETTIVEGKIAYKFYKEKERKLSDVVLWFEKWFGEGE